MHCDNHGYEQQTIDFHPTHYDRSILLFISNIFLFSCSVFFVFVFVCLHAHTVKKSDIQIFGCDTTEVSEGLKSEIVTISALTARFECMSFWVSVSVTNEGTERIQTRNKIKIGSISNGINV